MTIVKGEIWAKNIMSRTPYNQICMSREEVHEAGLDHPFVESIINGNSG